METHKDQLKDYSDIMWCHLIDRIDIKDYPYNYSELIKIKPTFKSPPHPYKKLMEQNIICNDNIFCKLFTTKCLHKHFINKYKNLDIQKCWAEAMRLGDIFDIENFKYFTDITKIPDDAYEGNHNLKSFKVPESIKVIGSNSFSRCINLKTITFPKSLTIIESGAFFLCKSITSVNFSNPSGLNKIEYGAFEECESITKLFLPEGLDLLDQNAFKDCRNLESLKLPKSLKEITEDAFSGCSKLSSIIFLEGLESIGEFAFNDCHSLTSLKLPNGLIHIDSFAFGYCRNLKTVELPESLEFLDTHAFYDNEQEINFKVKRINKKMLHFIRVLEFYRKPDEIKINDNIYYRESLIELLDNFKKKIKSIKKFFKKHKDVTELMMILQLNKEKFDYLSLEELQKLEDMNKKTIERANKK
jgi:hypothetical protein